MSFSAADLADLGHLLAVGQSVLHKQAPVVARLKEAMTRMGITDGQNTMIAKIPASYCVGSNSALATGTKHPRAQFTQRYHPSTSHFLYTHAKVRITGVGFFDFLHGQSGVALNGIELHPVVDI